MRAKPALLMSLSEVELGQHAGDHIGTSDWQPTLRIPDWTIRHGEHWGVIGGNDQQRSAVCALLREQLLNVDRYFREISPWSQEKQIEEEHRLAQTGVADEINTGTKVHAFLANAIAHDLSGCALSTDTLSLRKQQLHELIDTFEFNNCLEKSFRDLSSGETRRALIIAACASSPHTLLMQDPYEGLDRKSRPVANRVLHQSLVEVERNTSENTSSMTIVSRWEQLPDHCTHLAYVEEDCLHTLAVNNQGLRATIAQHCSAISEQTAIAIPELPEGHPFHQRESLQANLPLVDMRNVTVSYADHSEPIIDNVSFRVMPLQHTQITGANGTGKSTLLKLITGDHPQVYRNEVSICGFKRGGGESIWNIKRYIGHMSGEMLWNYRSSGQLAGSAQNVLISGLYDSIGLYTTPNQADRQCASNWLHIVGLENKARQRFQQLSLAEQRLALIARAMIKRPLLLILDEPCTGLDQEDRRKVLAIIEKLIQADATTVLYVSHHDDEAVDGISNELSLDARN